MVLSYVCSIVSVMDTSTVIVRVSVAVDDVAVGSFDGEVAAERAASVSSLLSALAGSLRMDAVRSRHPNAYRPWTATEEERLASLHAGGASLAELSEELGRNRGGIRARLERLGLIPSG
jgi:hypothetical protein